MNKCSDPCAPKTSEWCLNHNYTRLAAEPRSPGVEKWDCFDHFKIFNDSPALDQTTATPSPLDIKQLTGKSLESSSMPLFLVGQKALLSLAKHD
jgi:hypothetical protein